MIRNVSLLSASALLLAACATVWPAPSAPAARPAAAPPAGLAVQDVAAGFSTAVVDGCTAAAESGKPMEQLNNPLIVADPHRSGMVRPRAGYSAWAPKLGQGIVMIDAGIGGCEVSTYGLPIENTFAAVAATLREKGYQDEAVPPQGAKYFAARLKKKVGDRTVSVSLSGNEPGAVGMRSRFSTALATITVATP